MGGAAVRPDGALSGAVLWYPRPAAEWLEALPVGNGHLGAMVFGGTDRELLQLSEDTLWAGGPHDYDNPRASAALGEVRRLVFAGEWARAAQLVDSDIMGIPVDQQQFQTVGGLTLDFPPGGEVTCYRRELDLERAVASVEYVRDGTRFRREVFAGFPDRVIAVRITADTPGAVGFTARFAGPLRSSLSSPDTATAAVDGIGDDVGELPGTVRFRALARALAEGGRVRSAQGTVTVEDADAVTLLISVGTSYTDWRDAGADERLRAGRDLERAARRGYPQLLERHLADWTELFGRADLEIPATPAAALPTDERVACFRDGDDPQLVALCFRYGRYLLISSSRPGTQPANLQGLWNDLRDPPWGGKYTININTEMNYWPAAPANLLECWEPVFTLLDELAVAGARTAASLYGARGWVTHHNTNAWRGTAPVDGAPWGMWPTGGAWMAMAIWEHYRFTGDVEALRRRYPVLRGAARFFLDSLVPDPESGELVTCPSLSPENEHHRGAGGALCAGPTMDNQILRDLFSAVESAAGILRTDTELRAEVAAARERLAPMRIGAGGQLQEWRQDWDAEAPEQDHRHISHLYGLHPGNQISKRGTPELFEAARTTLRQRGDEGTGWSLGWKINFWARMEDGDRSWKLLTDQLTPRRTAPNLFDLHPPFQIDGNFGAVSGITEWLLQSQHDELHLLPALPGALPAGSVRGLLARGGFEVDLSWERGALVEARVLSRLGRPVTLRTAARVGVTDRDGPVPTERAEQGVLTFATLPGESYRIRPWLESNAESTPVVYPP